MKDMTQQNACDLTLSQALEKIQLGECFSGYINNRSFFLRIDEYQPFLCTAIHNGHQLRPELQGNCMLSPEERFYEEDPYTDELILTFPVTLVGNDSRFEYDLNRPLNQSTYFKSAWEKQVWKRKLSQKQRDLSQSKHKAFYTVVEALVAKIESLFGGCLVFDIHSYNYQRHKKDTPTFNIGTDQIDMQRWSSTVEYYRQQIDNIALPNLDTRVAVNELFYGRGYLISHVNARFDKTLVLPTEVKKVFMDETTGEVFPLVLQELKTGFREVITNTAANFIRKHIKASRHNSSVTQTVLSSTTEPAVLEVDASLYKICKDLDILTFITPTNVASEKRRFMEKKGDYHPEFKYKQLNFDPYLARKALFNVPIERIEDIALQNLYRDLVEDLALRIDLLKSVGTQDYVYNSLRLFGKPEKSLLKSATFLASVPLQENNDVEQLMTADAAKAMIEQKMAQWDSQFKVTKSSKIIAKTTLLHDSETLMISASAMFTPSEVNAIVHNQLLVHAVSASHARKQPLKALQIGLPGYNRTQDGLGLYCEKTFGALTLYKLKHIALRALAVEDMLQHNDFRKTYSMLQEKYLEDADTAFTICTRAYRAGGTTKDYHYLAGLQDIMHLSKEKSLHPLFAGKTSLQYYDQLVELSDRGIVSSFPPIVELEAGKGKANTKENPLIEYLVQTLVTL